MRKIYAPDVPPSPVFHEIPLYSKSDLLALEDVNGSPPDPISVPLYAKTDLQALEDMNGSPPDPISVPLYAKTDLQALEDMNVSLPGPVSVPLYAKTDLQALEDMNVSPPDPVSVPLYSNINESLILRDGAASYKRQKMMSALTVRSRIRSVEAQVQNTGVEGRNIGMGLVIPSLLSDQVRFQIQQIMSRISLHDIWDPVFYVMDPLGRSITIQLSYSRSYGDLDRILKAYLRDRPEAGSRYVERGDYTVVSTEGNIIPPSDFAGKLSAGIQLEMGILKRTRDRLKPTALECPRCGHTNPDVAEDGWIHCSNPTCGRKYQISANVRAPEIEEIFSPQISQQEDRTDIPNTPSSNPTRGRKYQISANVRVPEIEEIFSPQISQHEDRTELFRRVNIVYSHRDLRRDLDQDDTSTVFTDDDLDDFFDDDDTSTAFTDDDEASISDTLSDTAELED